ncbi:MAG: folylpolyglutamate synthase/dihydrofolate synthase family protein [Ktedonobacterales bacterium]
MSYTTSYPSNPADLTNLPTTWQRQATTQPLTYREALAWLYAFSDTERTGAFVRDREDNLRRERTLLERLGDPQLAYGVIHIAGTKGKGSTAAILTAILAASGVRTGMYSQPDLHTFRERIRIDGAVIGEDEVARLTSDMQQAMTRLDPSLGAYITYEVTTALAFLALREANVDQAVIEVGLGGRLDATNVVQPEVCVITSISYDHMAVLGDTLGAIAWEKAGIIKQGVPVVTSAQAPEAQAVITRVATERGAPLIRIGRSGQSGAADYAYFVGLAEEDRQFFDLATPKRVYRNLELSLLGAHQVQNAAAAIAAAEQLGERGVPIDESAIREGLREVRWPGRLQVVGRSPLRVVDGAHNADSFAALFAALRRHFDYDHLLLVLGTMGDKDIEGILREVAAAQVDQVIVTAARGARPIPPAELAEQLRRVAPQLPELVAPTSEEALALATQLAGPRDLVCVAGSLYLAGEALRWFATQPDVVPGAIEIAGVDH